MINSLFNTTLKKIIFSLSVSIIINSVYTFKFYNYPFHTELYVVFVINFFVGLSLFFLSIYIFLYIFINKSGLIFSLIKLFFYFLVFVYFIKSVILLMGFDSLLSFLLIFDIDIFTRFQRICLILSLIILFILVMKCTNLYKFNFVRFINTYAFILLNIIIYNFIISDQFFPRSHIFKKDIDFIKVDKLPDRRVIFLIFDELDYELLIDNEKDLKNFSKLKEISANFENTNAPGRDTANSISALLIGHNGIGKIGFKNSNYFFYNKDSSIATEKKNNFKKFINFDNSFFSFASKNNTSLIGSQLLTYCIHIDIYNCTDSTKDMGDISFQYSFKSIRFILKSAMNYVPLKKFIISDESKKIHTKNKKLLKIYNKIDNKELPKNVRIINNAYSAISNTEQEIVFVHYPFPHPPSNYAEKILGDVDTNLNFDYKLNLQLSDLVLGKILKILKKNPNDQDILLIVSSDHGIRRSIHNRFQPSRKVPLIININTDNSKYVVNEKVSSFNIKELIGKFLNKEINNHNDIKNFFSNSDFIPTTNLNEDLLMKRRFYNQK